MRLDRSIYDYESRADTEIHFLLAAFLERTQLFLRWCSRLLC